jgi:hypothetical protein
MTFSINPTANKTQAMFQQMAIAQNGTGTASAITGGTSSAAAPPPPAASSAAPPAGSSSSSSSGGSSSGSMVSGTGSLNSGGACECACLCGVASFPSAAQGLGGYGGMSGKSSSSLIQSILTSTQVLCHYPLCQHNPIIHRAIVYS